jgi:hypothetical protein
MELLCKKCKNNCVMSEKLIQMYEEEQSLFLFL